MHPVQWRSLYEPQEMQAAFQDTRRFQGRTSITTANPWQRGQYRESVATRTVAARTGERRASPVQKSIQTELQDRRRHSTSRSNSFPPLRRSESKERPNQVSWKPQDSQLERENAELRAQLRRQEKEMTETEEMLQNLLSVKDRSPPPVIQTSPTPRQNILLPPSTNILARPVTAARYPNQKENY
ncbi:hypothetical protein HPB48_021521 [Haemaphysalis longicornis]|uniref:Uncharacterized protein n=1 Tax=Haemaphysalis longicornis TaxID=44386 RepID=A0A9J6FKZ9_HAELO|nr:hypothetical protein HPB48_021521 [Haemaphysalis longicornis]